MKRGEERGGEEERMSDVDGNDEERRPKETRGGMERM